MKRWGPLHCWEEWGRQDTGGGIIVDSQKFGLLGFQKLGIGCLHTGQNVYLMRVTLFLPLGHLDTPFLS